MSTVAAELRREALRAEREAMHDEVDVRSTVMESPQEMHERMLAEDASEETLDLLEGLRELQGGELVVWKVFRIAGPNGEPLKSGPSEFLGALGSNQLTMENLASLYGGGKYRVRGRYSDGKIAGGRTITIAADAKREDVMPAQHANAPFNMQEFFALQEMREESRRKEDERRRDEQERRDDKRNALILGALPTLGTVLTALLGRAPAPVVATPPPPDPIQSLKGLAELMVTMQSLVPQAGGGEDSLVSIIKAVAPHAGPVLSALAARQSAPLRGAAPTPAPGSQPTVTVIEEPKPLETVAPQPTSPQVTPHTGVDLNVPSRPLTPEQRQMFAQLKPQVDTLVQIAREGGDALKVADTFFETTMLPLPDEGYDRLCEFFEDPKTLEHIAVLNTGVLEQRAFFETLQNRIKERIALESPEDGTGDRE
jgi:hypothetical protein